MISAELWAKSGNAKWLWNIIKYNVLKSATLLSATPKMRSEGGVPLLFIKRSDVGVALIFLRRSKI